MKIIISQSNQRLYTHLFFMRENSADDDVVQGLLRLQAEALSDGLDSLRPEVSFRVKVDHLALAASSFIGELTSHTQSVHELRLASAELSENFSDRSGLDTAAEDAVEGSGASGHADYRSSLLFHLETRLKLISAAIQLFASLADLLNSGLCDTLDRQQITGSALQHTSNCGQTSFLKLLYITHLIQNIM